MPRGISWSFNETDALIRFWADSATQTALRLNSRNRCIYEDIANRLQSLGITRSADQCQMRIKLLKKLYRQTNEAIQRGDAFQQRACPFYDEMHRIFGSEETNSASLVPNSHSMLYDDDNDESEEKNIDQENIHDDEENRFEDEVNNHVDTEIEQKSEIITTTEDKLTMAIDRLIEYQKRTETRWYEYLEQQSNLESKRRQEDRAYQLQLFQLLTSAIASKTTQPPSSSSPALLSVLQQLLLNNAQIDKSSQQQQQQQQHGESFTRTEKRKCSPIPSSTSEKKAKIHQSLPPNFYSLLAQIHNINNSNPSGSS